MKHAHPIIRLIILTSLALAASADATQKRVLYLGDSLSMGAFGRTLDGSLRDNELEVFTHVAGGASPYYWLRRFEPISCSIGYWEKTPERERRVGYVRAVPKVEDLIDDYEPDVVVVQTGVNLYATLRSKRRPKEANVQMVEALIEDMCLAARDRGAQTYWIAPPESHPKKYPEELQNELTGIMQRVVGSHGGRVFESADVTNWTLSYPGQSDGIHYGPTESKAWAVQVADDLQTFVSDLKEPIIAQAEPEQPATEEQTVESPEVTAASEPIRAMPIAMKPSQGAEADPQPAGAQTQVAAASPGIGLEFDPTIETSEEVTVTLVLKEKSSLENLNEVDYNNAFGLFEYEVQSVSSGDYPLETIRVAHMIVLHDKVTAPNSFKVGNTYHLTLVKLEKYPRLQQIQMVDQLAPNFQLPIYICKF